MLRATMQPRIARRGSPCGRPNVALPQSVNREIALMDNARLGHPQGEHLRAT